ncbi:hypothetical protein N2W52_002048 [Clostridium perfringens]|nr:hypothetical protein [Clostridium perfringens]MDK0983065.1 hypothetical protein [Clostridium perfringens]
MGGKIKFYIYCSRNFGEYLQYDNLDKCLEEFDKIEIDGYKSIGIKSGMFSIDLLYSDIVKGEWFSKEYENTMFRHYKEVVDDIISYIKDNRGLKQIRKTDYRYWVRSDKVEIEVDLSLEEAIKCYDNIDYDKIRQIGVYTVYGRYSGVVVSTERSTWRNLVYLDIRDTELDGVEEFQKDYQYLSDYFE